MEPKSRTTTGVILRLSPRCFYILNHKYGRIPSFRHFQKRGEITLYALGEKLHP